MSNIRVTYSGFISLMVSLVGVITGIIFTVMVTRKLTQEDFGLWTLIGSVVSYVAIIEGITTYWTTRQTARGEDVGKTALVTNLLFSVGGLIIYLICAFFISSSLKSNFFVFLLAGALIPLTFLNNVLNSISLGFRPQGISYGILAFEGSKIPLGVWFVVVMHLGMIGALIATIGASIAKLIVLLIVSKHKIIGSIDMKFVKFWIKMSWLSFYKTIEGFVSKLDVLMVSMITGSLFGIAYWGVAMTVSGLVANSGNLSQGLFPKLLATARKDIVEENLKRTMYFAIPFFATIVVFAKPILFVLNPTYVDGTFIIIIAGLRTLLTIFIGFSYGILESYENVDIDKQATIKKYVKSNLFLTSSLNLISSSLYIGILAVYLLFIKVGLTTPTHMTTIWSLILLGVTIPFIINGTYLIKKRYQIVIPYVALIKFSFAAFIASMVTFLILQVNLTYTSNIFGFISQLIPLIGLGGGIYFLITYLIDNSTRSLFKLIIKEFTKK